MIQKLIQEASLHYLNHLTSAIQRWKGKGLSGHSRTILYVVDDLLSMLQIREEHETCWFWGLFSSGMYLGFFRTQIRKKFNIRLAGELFKGGGET
ncbi:uncharacterized protein [Euphorbia lathyris]|uniref:uncharacterized protein isoform X4 n=1 Tax=Euphorbia lathyris TaxID=212925 RepID=UPI003313ADF6